MNWDRVLCCDHLDGYSVVFSVTFCLALENGHMKAYRDESVRLQLIHLVHTVQALSLAFIIPFAMPL